MRIVWVPLSQIYPREFYNGDFANSGDAVDYIAERLVSGKKLEPIVVCPRGWLCFEDKRCYMTCHLSDFRQSKKAFLLANGHHRYKVAKVLALSLVPCVFSKLVNLKLSKKVVWF